VPVTVSPGLACHTTADAGATVSEMPQGPGIALVSWWWHHSRGRRDCSRVLTACIQATSLKGTQGVLWWVAKSLRARCFFFPTHSGCVMCLRSGDFRTHFIIAFISHDRSLESGPPRTFTEDARQHRHRQTNCHKHTRLHTVLSHRVKHVVVAIYCRSQISLPLFLSPSL